jgi:hypothetical protein
MEIRDCPTHMKQPTRCEIVYTACNHEEYPKYAEYPCKDFHVFLLSGFLVLTTEDTEEELEIGKISISTGSITLFRQAQ